MSLLKLFRTVTALTTILLLLFSCSNSISESEVDFGEMKYNSWTIMCYIDADNNLEQSLIYDVYEAYKGYQENVNILILIDRHPGFSAEKNLFGANFNDTRLFRLTRMGPVRISGESQFPEVTMSSNYEANMGDATNLRKFIDFSKANYPAKKYALIISSHGGGSRSDDELKTGRGVTADYSDSNDQLFTAEITDVLGPEHSVDLFGLDACYMGNIEFAYQFRPGNGDFNTRILVGSGPEEWGPGWKFDNIYRRIGGNGATKEEETITGGLEERYRSEIMSAEQFARIIVEEYRDSSETSYHSLGAYDLTKIELVKAKVDELAALLVNNKTDIANIVWTGGAGIGELKLMNYFKSVTSGGKFDTRNPYFDLYALCDNITVVNGFEAEDEAKALEVKAAVDEMTLYSFGNTLYPGFQMGKNGISIFLSEDDSFSGQTWYTPKDIGQTLTGSGAYGKLAWCGDGAAANDGRVSNWFELMDKLYDSGDSNGYTP